MKKTYFKYIFNSMKMDFTRLLAIFLIVFLGVGFVIGLLSTTPDLRASVNNYYIENNVQDIHIQSTLGFDYDDIDDLSKEIREIDKIEAHYEEDLTEVYLNNSRIQARLNYRTFTDDSIDVLELVEGRYPQNGNECVMLKVTNDSMTSYSLNDVVRVNNTSYTIVGVVDDPIYISRQSISSPVGKGSLDGIIYLDETFIDPSDITYTIIKITLDDSAKYNTFSDSYKDYVEENVDAIEDFSSELLESRVESIREIARQEIRRQILIQFGQLDENATIEESEELYNSLSDAIKTTIDSYVETQLEEYLGTISGQWYVLTREEIEGFALFEVDSGKVDAIASIFPVFFFAIALLVSVSSISRLVSKDRQMMGTFKSLGFGKRQIFLKYFLYGLISSTVGAIVGSTLGIFLLPYIIYVIYGSLYTLPSIVFTYQIGYIALFSSIIVVSIIVAISIICYYQLHESVSNLLIGKAPIAGKKIFLEKIPFIWKKLSFNMKSMLRNVFRFKKNLIMMIIGIGGCSAILLTGFGVQDSLNVLVDDQYTTIFKYDLIISVNDIDGDIEELNSLDQYDEIYYFEGDVLGNSNIPIILLGSDNLPTYIGFDNNINFNANSVIITKQISTELNLKIGDHFILKLDDKTEDVALTVTGITTNYINNYVYIGENVMRTIFSESNDISHNGYIAISDLSDEEIENLVDNLSHNEYVVAVTSKNATEGLYSNVLDNLGAVVLILILLSGALIAVVIYNLTDIIINERIKEIATLRVNGYFRREALFYIYKEIIFMSIIGIIVGTILGVFLHRFAVSAISSIGITFGTVIAWPSYIYSILLAILFITLTALVFYPKIKNISMSEALKSVD